MTKRLEVISEPVTIDQAKRQCYIPVGEVDPDVDELLDLYIATARGVAENWTWRQLVHGKYQQTSAPSMSVKLEKTPLIKVDRVEYYGAEGDLIEVSDYQVDTLNGTVKGAWPRDSVVVVTYEAGGHDCPEPLKAVILMLVKMYYDNRDAAIIAERSSIDAVEIPFGVRMILDSYSQRSFE